MTDAREARRTALMDEVQPRQAWEAGRQGDHEAQGCPPVHPEPATGTINKKVGGQQLDESAARLKLATLPLYYKK